MKCDELQYERLGDANKTYPASTLVIRKQFVDAAIAELKTKLEDVQATAYAESVDACMENRRLVFELREAKNDAWAANLVLKDARSDLRKQIIKRCRQNQEYCYLRFLNEGRTRALFWLKWKNRWIELEKFYKESETEDR